MLPLLSAAIVHAGSSEPIALEVMRHPQDHLVLSFPGLHVAEVANLRIQIDSVPQSGDPASGADWLIEKGSIFSFAPHQTDWSWNRIGPVSISSHKGSTYLVLLEKLPLEHGTILPDPDSRVAFTFKELPLWPDDCVPTAYPLDAWLQGIPPSLSVRLKDEVNRAEWTEPEAPWSPGWTPFRGDTNKIPLVVELINPRSGLAQRLEGGSFLRSGEITRWFGEAGDIQWTLLFRTTAGGGLEITGHLVSENDQPVRARIGVQLPLRGWRWYDSLDDFRIIDERALPYVVTADVPINNFEYSRWPFGVVSTNHIALMIDNSPHEPRLFRIDADPAASRFGITYDLALTRSTVKFPGQATFQCLFHATNLDHPDDAMRQSLAEYYARTPDVAKSRLGISGSWAPFPSENSDQTEESLPVLFNVRAAGDQVSSVQLNGRSRNFLYTEPWYHWLPLPPGLPRDESTAWSQLTFLATAGKGYIHQLAASTLGNVARTSRQNPDIQWIDVPWNQGARCRITTDPEMPISSSHGLSTVNRAMVEAAMIDAHAVEQGWDGVFLDSMGELNFRDFSAHALEAADYPALYDLETGSPFVLSSFSAFEWLQALRNRADTRGRFLLGNGALRAGPWFITLLDAFTEEVHIRNDSRNDQLTGRSAQFTRMLAGAKPVSVGLMADFEQLTGSELETFLRNCLYYGFMPGFHSKDGYHGLFWKNQDWYQRHRKLIDQYLPLIQRVSDAGWSPTRSVLISHPGIELESFGPDDAAMIYTMHNKTGTDANGFIHLPLSHGLELIHFPLSGQVLYREAGSRAPFEYRMAPGEVTLFTVITEDHITKEITRFAGLDSAQVNLGSAREEISLGLRMTLDYDSPLIRHEPTTLRAIFHNAGTNKLNIKNVKVKGATSWKKPRDPSFTLNPGESYTSFIPMTAKDLKDNARLHVSWTCASREISFECNRIIQPRYTDAFDITVTPDKPISIDTTMALDISLVNHRSSFREFEISAEGESLHESGVITVAVEGGSRQHYRLLVPGNGALIQSVDLTVKENKTIVYRDTIDVTYLPEGASLARDSRVTVATSGSAEGYQSDILRDGITDMRGLLWTEGSWMSMSRLDSHHVTLSFPHPVIISEVVLHWGTDARQPHPSLTGILKAKQEDGRTVTLSRFSPSRDESLTRFAFEPVQVKELELIQPPVSGSFAHPLAMWLTEIEVY